MYLPLHNLLDMVSFYNIQDFVHLTDHTVIQYSTEFEWILIIFTPPSNFQIFKINKQTNLLTAAIHI